MRGGVTWSGLPRAAAHWVLRTSMDGEPTASLGSLCRRFTNLTVAREKKERKKKVFSCMRLHEVRRGAHPKPQHEGSDHPGTGSRAALRRVNPPVRRC